MMLLTYMFQEAINSSASFIALWFYSVFLQFKKPYALHKPAVYLVHYIAIFLISMLRVIPVLNNELGYGAITFTYFAFQLVLLFVVFEGSVWYKLFIFFINKLVESVLISFGYSYLILAFPELSLALGDHPILSVAASYSILILLDLLFSLLFVGIIKLFQRLRLTAATILFYFLIPVSQFFLFIIIMSYTQHNNELWIYNPFNMAALFGMLLACIGDIALFTTLRRFKETAQMENQLKINALQQQYYSLLEVQQQQVREMQHDINNHLATIKALTDSTGTTGSAVTYSDELSDKYRLFQLDYCSNSVLNALLVNKAIACQNLGIQNDFEVALSSQTPVDDIDLVSLFSNLIDNAIEATANSDAGKSVCLRVREQKNTITVICENPLPENASKPRISSGKMSHGNGQNIIRRIAGKYHGDVQYQIIDRIYRVTAVLFPVKD